MPYEQREQRTYHSAAVAGEDYYWLLIASDIAVVIIVSAIQSLLKYYIYHLATNSIPEALKCNERTVWLRR